METIKYNIEDLLILGDDLRNVYQQLINLSSSIIGCRSEIERLVNSKDISSIEHLVDFTIDIPHEKNKWLSLNKKSNL